MIAKLQQKVSKEDIAKITKDLQVYKNKFELDDINAQAANSWRKYISN